jgi:hypothetical protein
MNAKEFLNTKGITKATCYTDNGTYYFNELADILEDFLKAQTEQKLNIHGIMQAEGSDGAEGAAVGNSAVGQDGRVACKYCGTPTTFIESQICIKCFHSDD